MNVLFFMDPFIDLPETAVDRSFSARYDLALEGLVKAIKIDKSITVRMLTIDKLFTQQRMKDLRNKYKIICHLLGREELKTILSFSNCTSEMVLYRDHVPAEFIKNYAEMLGSKMSGWSPDIIYGWEYVPTYLNQIFPKALLLEGRHTGFYRINKRRDVIFSVKNNMDSIQTFVHSIILSDRDRDDLDEIRNTARKVCKSSAVTRKTIDPVGRFSNLVFFPGHYQAADFFKYTFYQQESDLISEVLAALPHDCGLVYAPHPIAPRQSLAGIEQLSTHPQLIQLGDWYAADPANCLNVVDMVDAVINMSSNTAQLAMLMRKPLITFSRHHTIDFSYGSTIETLIEALNSKNNRGNELQAYYEKSDKYLSYIFKYSVKNTFFNSPENSRWFYSILDERHKNDYPDFKIIPQFQSLSEIDYAFEARQVICKSEGRALHEKDEYEQLRGMILNSRYKVIGFDVFDTMVCRPAAFSPDDIFRLMNRQVSELIGESPGFFNFRATRTQAERYAAREEKKKGNKAINIDSIYYYFQKITGLDQSLVEKIRELEIKTELAMLRPRKSLRGLYYLAKDLRRDIAVISDMYLSSEIIGQALAGCGYEGVNHLFISCEHNTTKRSGGLFQKAFHDMHVEPQDVLFIGDNRETDVNAAQKCCATGFHFPKAADVFSMICTRHPHFKLLTDGSLYPRHHFSLAANKIYDNPFLRHESLDNLFNGNMYTLGYFGFGPFMTSLALWLVIKVKEKKLDKILFLSRDGFNVKRMYDFLNDRLFDGKLVDSKYYYLSRHISVKGLFRQPLLATLMATYKLSAALSLQEALERFFGLKLLPEIHGSLLKKYGLNLKESARNNLESTLLMLTENYDFFSNIQESGLGLAKKYFQQEVGGEADLRLGCFDASGFGSAGRYISRLSGNQVNAFMARGAYFVEQLDENRDIFFSSLPSQFGASCMNLSAPIVEEIISNRTEGTTIGYEEIDGKVNPVFDSDFVMDVKHASIIGEIQKGFWDFFQDYLALLEGNEFTLNSVPTQIVLWPIELLTSGHTDLELANQLMIKDEFFSLTHVAGKKSIISPDIGQNFKKNSSVKVKTPIYFQTEKRLIPKGTVSRLIFRIGSKSQRMTHLGWWLCGSQKKYEKFITNPKRYFADSKSRCMRLISKLYSKKNHPDGF